MDGHRSHARYCGGACRADASRIRRIVAGNTVDGARSVADIIERAQKRTTGR